MAAKDKDTVSLTASTDNLSIVLDTTPSINHQTTDNKPIRSSFRHLFSFTRWNQAAPLTAALTASAAFAAIKSIYPIFLGKIFNIVSDFGAGRRSGSETLHEISHWSQILIGLAIVNCLSGSAFLALWVIFGELQAKSVRQDVFKSLLSKNMAWFDSLDQGISSLLVRIQTQVYNDPTLEANNYQVLTRSIGKLENFSSQHRKSLAS
jgi:ATP-binding cassette subfamily B (MDR/TAP) protein 1